MKTTVINIRDAPPGWETNPNYVYVGRPGRGLSGQWGNPHPVDKSCSVCGGVIHTRQEAIAIHRTWALRLAGKLNKVWEDVAFKKSLETLRGKYLVCFCKKLKVEVPCHADVYVELLEGSR